MTINYDEIDTIIERALMEDIGQGDITSNLTIPLEKEAEFRIRAREPMVVCGLPIAERVFKALEPSITIELLSQEGRKVAANTTILKGQGTARDILAGERVALNLLRQTCGVATYTRQFVDAIQGTKARILDTRKTIPGLRVIQKYAVTMGGGHNHRFRLDDGILIKDNHISVCGGITQAVNAAKRHPDPLRIEVECDTLEQVQEALTAGADIILLDNMDIKTLTKAVQIVNGAIPLEASGNVTLDTVAAIAKTGVDFISIGRITHSPLHVDLGLDMDW